MNELKYRGPRKVFGKNLPKIRAFIPCTYCKVNSANSWDHILPYSYGGTEDSNNLVPCCMGCNLMLGNLLFYSIEEKSYFVKLRINGLSRRKAMNTLTLLRLGTGLHPTLLEWLVKTSFRRLKEVADTPAKTPFLNARKLYIQSELRESFLSTRTGCKSQWD